MECTFDLARCSRHTAAAIRIVAASEFRNIAFGIFHHFVALYDISTFETNFRTRCETEKFLGRILHEVVALDKYLAGEWHLMCAALRFFRIVIHFYCLYLPLRIVGYDYLYRIDDSHSSCGMSVQILTHRIFEQRHAIECFIFRITDALNEVTDCSRCESTAAHSGYGRHAGIIPTGYKSLFHKLEQLALAHHSICEVQPVELNLTRAICVVGKLTYKIIIERTMWHKLQCADRMCYTLEIIALTMREIIHWIDLPGCTRAVVRMLDDSIHDRITEMHI